MHHVSHLPSRPGSEPGGGDARPRLGVRGGRAEADAEVEIPTASTSKPLMIVQELLRVQERCGWLPKEEMRGLAERLNVPLHRIHEVASFYPLYRLEPPPVVDVKVCRDMSCHLQGAAQLPANLQPYAPAQDAKQ